MKNHILLIVSILTVISIKVMGKTVFPTKPYFETIPALQ